MANFSSPWPGDFESVARQYWNLWGDALRQAGGAPPAAAAAPGWQQAVDWWSQLVPGGNPQVHDVLGRFQRQAGDWFGQMQQVAAQFAGRDQAPADITRAWREALGMASPQPAHNPFADIFRTMHGSGTHGLDGWMAQARPYLEAMQRDHASWMQLPTFGLSREHQERWQSLARAQQDYQQQVLEYDQLMLKVAQRAFELFEQKLTERMASGQQIDSARGLFDVWIDAAEVAYAEVALSAEFRTVYGALANAQMRLRLGVQREVEQVCAMFGMPTRTEVDSAHRKIVELERALRRATRQAGPVRQPAAPASARDRGNAVADDAVARTEATAPAADTSARRATRPAAKRAKPAPRKSAPPKAAARTPRRTKPAPTRTAATRATRAAASKPVKQAAAPRTSSVATKTNVSARATARTATSASRATVASTRKPAATPAAKPRTGAAVTKAARAPARTPAVKKAPTSSATRASTSAPGKKASTTAVVSMKDWVARNVAAGVPAADTPREGKRGKKKGRA